jgi:hypothetical protein
MAFSAICFVDDILPYQEDLLENQGSIPIDIVQEKRIGWLEYAAICPAMDRQAFLSMGHPLLLIKKLL